MANLTALTRGGLSWIPKFLQSINKDTCLGCGRCFKVCGRDVMELRWLNEDGEFAEEDDEDDLERRVMVLANPDKCIGCEACARICPKRCHSHAPLPA